MSSRTSALATVAALVAAASVAPSQAQTTKTYRIGWLGLGQPTPMTNRIAREPFLTRLRERGWIEGRDFVMEYRSAGTIDRLGPLAAELVQLRVDVIVATNHSAIDAAVRTTTSVPIVMGIGSDPIGMGWVKSLSRPGGNVTGMASIVTPEITGKRLGILREALPTLSRVGALWWPDVKDPVPLWSAIQEPSRRLGITPLSFPVRSEDDIDKAFAAATRDRVEAIMVQGDIFLFQHRRRIIELAATHRIPAAYGWATYVDSGGLMSYGASLPQFFRRAADYVDRILRGATPAELPIEQPTEFELVINHKTAKSLGLALPPSLLSRADRVIE